MKPEKTINGIQQIGIGVHDAKEVFNWYRRNLGFDILVFEDEAKASLMTQYTNGDICNRYAMLVLNMIGGGGLEIWQFKNRIPQSSLIPILLGDLGINIMKVRSNTIENVYASLNNHSGISTTEIYEEAGKNSHFYFSDPWHNQIQIVDDTYCFCASKSNSGGVLGAIIGVSDMAKSIEFYKILLGYDEIVYDKKGVFEDFLTLPGGNSMIRRVLLKSSPKKVGGFGELLGPTEIELIQVLDRQPNKIYKNRLWGDLGYIHLCFDIQGMDALREDAKLLGHGFTVDSAESFDMGGAAGHFSYVEDPDGTLIEFVETHKVPILKKLGIFINMKKRNPKKPLPKWLVKGLRMHKVKNDLV